jgi:hypothetical protein
MPGADFDSERLRCGSLRIPVRVWRVGGARTHALRLGRLLGALRQLFLRQPFGAEFEQRTRRLGTVGQLRRGNAAGARPFEIGQQRAARIVGDRGD